MHKVAWLAVLSLLWAQGSITATEPNLQVCGPGGTVTVNVYNTSPTSTLTGVELQVQMPPGVEYISGTVSPPGITELSTSPANQPRFGLPDLSPNSTLTITFQVQATCDILPFLGDPDNEVKNTYLLTWGGGGSASYTSPNEYAIDQPALQYTLITNQTFVATTLPQTFTRTFTVTNVGTAPLSTFRHSETAQSNVTITGASGGTIITHTPSNLVLEFSSTHFGGNGLLDPGESVNFTVTYTVIGSCSNTQSDFSLTWGCNSQVCATVTATGAVDVSGLGVPNLGQPIYPSGNGWFRFVQERACYGDDAPSKANRVRLGFRNSGSGNAKDIEIDLYVTWWPYTAYSSTRLERIDTNSIVLRKGIAGPTLPRIILPGSVDAGTAHACFTAPDRVKKLTLFVPGPIAPGETLYVEYDLYTCQLNSVFPCPSGRTNIFVHNLSATIRYKSGCGETYSHVIQGFGRYLAQAVVLNDHPGSVADGGTFQACFTITENPASLHDRGTAWSSLSGAPSTNSYRFRWEITLPPMVVYTGGPVRWTSNAGDLWNAYRVTQAGTALYIDFRHNERPAAWGNGRFRNSFICVPLQVVCGGNPSGIYTISGRVWYSTDTTCNADYACWGFPQSTEIAINCPTPCPQGVETIAFSMERTSYGLQDDNNDGIADANAPPTLTLIKRRRLMHTDTATAQFVGVIRGGPWNHVWAILQIDNHGQRFVALDASITIRKAGGGATYTFTRPILTGNYGGAPHNRRFAIDLRRATLIGAGVVPPGFQWNTGDTVRIALRVRLDQNVGGAITSTRATPYLYTTTDPSDLPPNLTPHTTRHECGMWRENLELVGWYFHHTNPLVFSPTAAQPCRAVVDLYYYLSIGPCCSYCGNNLFPFEYRQWSLPDYFVATLPKGWRPVSGTVGFWHLRTQGNSTGLSSSCVSQSVPVGSGINPTFLGTNGDGSTNWRFPALAYFQGHGGTLYPSTGGYYGYLRFSVEPSCQSAIYERDGDGLMGYTVYFTGRLSGSTSSLPISSGRLRLRYSGPNLEVKGLPAVVSVKSNIVEWRVRIKNLSNALPATNTFVYFRSATGSLSVVQVIDEATGSPITPVGDVYPVTSSLAAGAERYIRVRASFLSCALDTLYVYAGWSCAGYPTAASAYACYNDPTTPRDTLRYIPSNPDILLSSTITPNPSNLCDPLTVEITLQNGGTSAAYEPALFMLLPAGVSYVSGSAQYLFPSTGTWQPLADPNPFFIFWVWNFDSQTNPTGITDTGATSTFKVRFQVTTNCSYTNNLPLRIYARYKNYCGQYYYRISTTPVIALQNAIVPYTTSISGPHHTVERCEETLTYTISITNLGPGSTTSFDSVRVTFPAGVTYVAGSTTALTNFTAHNPNITSSGSNVILQWGLQSGHGAGTLMQFSFQVTVGPSLPSGTYGVSVQTIINATQACGATTCNTFLSTGTTTLNLTINRPVGVWTGDVSTDWFEPYNWWNCQVPTCNEDVRIPSTPRGNRYPLIDNLIVNGAAACRDIRVENGASLTISSTGRLDICRHVNFLSGSQLIAQVGSQVHFVGSTNQIYTFKGTGSWYHVTMNQGVAGQRLILIDDLVLDGDLTLTRGVIDGFSNNKEVFVRKATASAVIGGNLDSYISGYLRRNINTTAIDGWYNLPVGDYSSGRGYELAQLIFEAVPATQQILASFHLWPSLPPPSSPSATDCGAPFGLLPLLDHGYWIIERTAGAATPYHLRVFSRGYTNATGVGYTIAKRPTGSGSPFTFEGVCEGAPYDQASQTGRLNVPDFSEFAVAQTDQPLPVRLLYLQARPRTGTIQLTFTSRLTGPVSHYEILRREESETSWKLLTTLLPHPDYPSGGQLYQWWDGQVLSGLRYYYQVAAVDKRGDRTFSNIVEAMVTSEGGVSVQLYPNPSEGTAWVVATEPGLSIRVLNVEGKVLWEGKTGEGAVPLPASLPAGTYLVEVGSEHLRWVKVR